MFKYLAFLPLLWLASISVAQNQLVSTQKPLPNIVTAQDFLGRHAPLVSLDIITDSMGYVYLTNREGVQRFDGFQLRDLAFSKEALGKTYYAFHKDGLGKIWLYGHHGVARIHRDSIIAYELPQALSTLCKMGIESFHIDAKGWIHIAPKGRGYYTLSPQGVATEVIGYKDNFHGFAIAELWDGSPFYCSYKKPNSTQAPLSIYGYNEGKLNWISEINEPWPRYASSLTVGADGALLFSTGGHKILKIKGQELLFQHQFQHIVLGLFTDSRNDLWIGTLDHGLFRMLNDDFSSLDQFWEGDAAVITYEDQKGGLWLKSNAQSFGYIPHPEIVHYSSKNGLTPFEETHVILNTKSGVVCLAPPRGMYHLGDTINYVPIPARKHLEGTANYDVNPLAVHSDTFSGSIWFGFRGEIAKWKDGTWLTYLLDTQVFDNTEVWKIKAFADGTILGSTLDQVFTLRNDSLVPISEKSDRPIVDFDRGPRNQLWVAKGDGLWLLQNGEFRQPSNLNNEVFKTPCLFVEYAQGALWAQMFKGSLYRIIDDRVKMIKDPQGDPLQLSLHSVSANGSLWGIAHKGNTNFLCQIESQGDSVEVQPYTFDTEASKGPLHRAFLATDEAIYWGSAFGTFISKIDHLNKQTPSAQTAIREIRINHRAVQNASAYQLRHNENYINLLFDGIGFDRAPIEFRYQLKGLDSSWTLSEYQQVQYTNLSPGSYSFVVQARQAKSNDPWGTASKVSINILAPYWTAWWFKLCVSVLGILALLLVIYYRSRYLLQRERTKSQIALEMSRLELRALKAQINPHFIFNAMSSATYYLSKNKAEDARSYLVRFSKLMRHVLENSEKSTVSLRDEIELMRYYIALESERFQGTGIEFDVKLDQTDLNEALIPPALFQPYLENAIWHGLKDKSGSREISLQCSQNNGLLKFVIEDNGIGRDAAAESETDKEGHRSYGMMIAARRIELLNQQKVRSVQVEDLKGTTGEALGTRVSFQLPIQPQGFLRKEPETPELFN